MSATFAPTVYPDADARASLLYTASSLTQVPFVHSCVLALVVPVSIAVLLIAYKRRSEASGGTPGVVSTQEPMEEGFPDDEPDSPRAPDPFASAFASGGADDEDERRL